MTTARKVLLIIATALVAAGIVLAGTAFALAGFDFRNLSNDNRDWVRQTWELPAEKTAALSAIEVSDGQGIRVEGYDGDTVRIEYWEHQNRGVAILQDGSMLSVNGDVEGNAPIGILVANLEDHTTLVQVPRDFAGSIGAYGTDGDASIANFEHLDEANAVSQNGAATANAVEARSVRVESDNGLVQANSVTADERLAAVAGNGDVTLDSVLADEVRASSENGSVSVASTTATALLNVQAKNGSANLFRIDAPLIEASSDNGDVELSLPGKEDDYRIDANAANGVVDNPALSQRAGAREVVARSVNGNIAISYDGANLEESSLVYRGEALTWALSTQDDSASGEDEAAAAEGIAEAAPAAPTAPAAPADPAAPAAPASATATGQEASLPINEFWRGCANAGLAVFDAFGIEAPWQDALPA